MSFATGIVIGVVIGEWATFGAIALGHILAERRKRLEWHDGMDGLLWTVGHSNAERELLAKERKARNRERVLDAAREVAEKRDVAWKN